MTLALAAATVPPVPGMTHQRLDHRISSRDALTLLMTMFVGCAVAQASHVVLLRSQAWYHGGTGTSEHVSPPVNNSCLWSACWHNSPDADQAVIT